MQLSHVVHPQAGKSSRDANSPIGRVSKNLTLALLGPVLFVQRDELLQCNVSHVVAV
jgi:hypothetical protein